MRESRQGKPKFVVTPVSPQLGSPPSFVCEQNSLNPFSTVLFKRQKLMVSHGWWQAAYPAGQFLVINLGWNGRQQTCNQFRNITEKALLRVLPTAFKPVLQQIRSLQAAWIRASENWFKLHASYTIRASYYSCCKQVRRGKFGKTRNMYRFCCKK